MHEGTLTDDLFNHVLTHAKEAGARRITRVIVSIGALSDATTESIQFYWDSLAPGTIAEGSALEFDVTPGTARCDTCGKTLKSPKCMPPAPNVAHFQLPSPAGTVFTFPVWKSKQMTSSTNIF